MDTKHFRALLHELLVELRSRKKTLPQYDNLHRKLSSLNKLGTDTILPYKPKQLAAICEEVRETNSHNDFELFRKIIMIECLLSNLDDISSKKYTTSIQEQFKVNFQRLFSLCQNDQGWAEYDDDVYWKDLAIARQQIYPAGVGIVEAYSGFGYRQGLNINPLESLRFLNLILSSGGRRGYYEIHTHKPLLSDFNEKGWHKCYMRIAEMLMMHKEVKGLFRSSWFFDPEIKNISPRLAYLQEMPLKYGAKIFYIGEDQTGNAFVRSKTRLKHYREGTYKPKTYLLVWPRKALLKWAESGG